MAPPQAIPILGQMEDTPVLVSHLWSGGYHIYVAKDPMLDFNDDPGNDLNSSRSLGPWRLFETALNNGSFQSHSNPVSVGV